MTQDFQKPFAAPPTIFMAAAIIAIVIGLVLPLPVLSVWVQITLGPLLILTGVLLIRASIGEIAKGGTTYDPFDHSTALVTSGIYQRSRNPGYLGLAVIHGGLAVLLDNVWIALTGLIAVLITSRFVIALEERKLTDTFGTPYTDYMARVRRWI